MVDAGTYYRSLTRQSLVNEFLTCLVAADDARCVDDLIYDRIADVNAVIAEQMAFGRTRLPSDDINDDLIRDIPSLIRLIDKYDFDAQSESAVRRDVSDVALRTLAQTLQVSVTALPLVRQYRSTLCAASEATAAQCAAELALLNAKLALVTAAARAKHFTAPATAANEHIRARIADDMKTCRAQVAEMQRVSSAYTERSDSERAGMAKSLWRISSASSATVREALAVASVMILEFSSDGEELFDDDFHGGDHVLGAHRTPV